MDDTTQLSGSLTRRRFVQAVAGAGLALAGASPLAGCASQAGPLVSTATADRLETTRIRLSQIAGICVSPQYVADDLLRAEGFTDVEYIQMSQTNPYPAFAAGDVDISMAFVAPFIIELDSGSPIDRKSVV